MRTNRMLLKIISYILIQAFICLDLFIAGAVAIPVDMSTLAPAMTMNKTDLQAVFSLNAKKNDEDVEWGELDDLDNNDVERTGEKMTADPVLSPQGTIAALSVQTGGFGLNSIDFEPVSPPPPDASLLNFFSNTSLRNVFGIYPYNKKKLEDKLNSYGLELISPEIDRKLLAYLLEVLEVSNKQFVGILKSFKITKIGFKPAIIKEGDVKSLEIDSNVLYLSPEFLDNRLVLRIFILNDAIGGLSKDTNVLEYVDEHGETKATTSKALGLGKSGDDMLRAMMKTAAEYTYPPYWFGFKKFILYSPDDEFEFMMLLRPNGNSFQYDYTRIGLSKGILKDQIRLYEDSPGHWQELFEALLVHEGGKKGHLKLWPLRNLEEIIAIFNWPKLVRKTTEDLIKDFVNENWPVEIVDRGPPPLEEWLPAAAVFNMSLRHFGYNSNLPEPTGIIWKEYQANYGMVQEKGLRSVAIWFWWLNDFRGLEIDLGRERDHRFAFLSDEEFAEVLKMKEDIQKEYENSVNGVKVIQPTISLKPMLTTIGTVLLTFIAALPVMGAEGTVVQSSGHGLDWIIMAGVILLFTGFSWLWKILPWGKTTEQRTVQLVNQAVRQYKRDAQNVDLVKLQKFYTDSSFKERKVIINTIRERILLKSNKIASSIFEPFFRNILEFGPKNVFQTLQNIVTEKMKIESLDSLKRSDESYVAIKSEIEKLGLKINADAVVTTLLPIMEHASFLGKTNADYNVLTSEPVYQRLHRAIEDEAKELRFSAASALNDFAELGMGTKRLVEFLIKYLRKATNISLPLERKITSVINLTKESVSSMRIKAKMPLSTTAGADNKPAVAIIVSTIKISRQSGKSMFTNKDMVESAI